MRLLITRPLEDAEPLAELLRARGHEVWLAPVMTILDVGEGDLALDDAQALLFTSANGVRAFARRDARRGFPAYAVGDATARAAFAAGFEPVVGAGGDVDDLARVVMGALDPARGALVHVAGSVRAGDLAGALTSAGFAVRRAVVYRAEPVASLAGEIAAQIREGGLDGVLLYSPRSARLFVDLALREAGGAAGLAGMTAYCLSPAVAMAAEPGRFGHLVTPQRSGQTELLDAIS